MRVERTDKRRDNRPEVIIRPSEADNDEELPLIPSHSNLLNLCHVSAYRSASVCSCDYLCPVQILTA